MSDPLYNLAEQNTSVPAIIPSAALVLRRTQTTLGLLRDVVQESSVDYWYGRGKEANVTNEWAGAGYSFGQCVRLDAAHWRAILQSAVSFAALQRIESAEYALKNAYDQLKNDKNFHYSHDSQRAFQEELPIAHWRVLESNLSFKESDEAQSFENLSALAILYDSSQLRNTEQLGLMLYLMKSRYPEETMNSILWQGISGVINYLRKNWLRALANFNRVIALSPKNTGAYFNRAYVYNELKNLHASLRDYTYVIRLEPEIAMSYFRRGSVKYDLGDYVGALEDLNHFLLLEPDSRGALANRKKVQSRLADSNADWKYVPLSRFP